MKEQVTKAIHNLRQKYWSELGVTPWDINNGLCDQFADDVIAELGLDNEQLFSLQFLEITNTGDEDWTDFFEPSKKAFSIKETHSLKKDDFIDTLKINADESHVWIVLKEGNQHWHFDAMNPQAVNNPMKLATFDKFLVAKKQNLTGKKQEEFLRKYKEASISLFKKNPKRESDSSLQLSL